MKPQPSWEFSAPDKGVAEWYSPTMVDRRSGETYPGKEVFGVADENEGHISKYGIPGDRLWVRETFFSTVGSRDPQFGAAPDYIYRADYEYRGGQVIGKNHWKPSIFMPRKLSRITLEIVSVRVERLQDISEQDAKAEGALGFHDVFFHSFYDSSIENVFRRNYAVIWEKINGEGSWKKNPWVWKITFKKL